MKPLFLIAIFFPAICMLSSCATIPASQQVYNQKMSWAARKNQLRKIKQWRVQGAIAIRLPKEAFSANLNWHQQLNRYQINLFGPLGFGAVQMQGRHGSFTLETSQGKHFTAKNPETLIQQQLGWVLPVSNLYYWIRSLPASHTNAIKNFDQYNHLVSLKQNGWSIHYLQYTGINGIDLPSKIYLENNRLSLRIVISQWQINIGGHHYVY